MTSEMWIGVIVKKLLSIAVEESAQWERYGGATDSAIIILVRSEKHNDKKLKRLLESEIVINLMIWIRSNNE